MASNGAPKINIPIWSFSCVITGKPEPHPSQITLPLSLHSTYEQAYYEQEQIGWEHFIRGRIVKTWIPFIKNLTIYQGIQDNIKHAIRCQLTWQSLFTYITDMWDNRCDVISTHFPTYEVQHLLSRIQQTYPRTPPLFQKDAYLFESPYYPDTSWNKNQITEWLRTVESATSSYQNHTRTHQSLLAPHSTDTKN